MEWSLVTSKILTKELHTWPHLQNLSVPRKTKRVAYRRNPSIPNTRKTTVSKNIAVESIEVKCRLLPTILDWIGMICSKGKRDLNIDKLFS